MNNLNELDKNKHQIQLTLTAVMLILITHDKIVNKLRILTAILIWKQEAFLSILIQHSVKKL